MLANVQYVLKYYLSGEQRAESNLIILQSLVKYCRLEIALARGITGNKGRKKLNNNNMIFSSVQTFVLMVARNDEQGARKVHPVSYSSLAIQAWRKALKDETASSRCFHPLGLSVTPTLTTLRAECS